jgi:predicted esterase
MSQKFKRLILMRRIASGVVVLAVDAQAARRGDQLLPAAAVGRGDLLKRTQRRHGRAIPEVTLVREQRGAAQALDGRRLEGAIAGRALYDGRLDAAAALKLIRDKYNIDNDRIFLMGHSMGGLGTYYLGGKYNNIWAGLAPISGLGGIADATAAERYKAIPMLLIHGEKDSIIPPSVSRRSVMFLQAMGAPHVYMEFPGMDHEFWIRRGAEHMEKPFLFFSMLFKQTNVGFITGREARKERVGGELLATVW